LPAGLLRNAADALISAYNPLLVLVFLGAVMWVDRRSNHEIHEIHGRLKQQGLPITTGAANEK
jgi:hypothetical protein